MMRFRTPLVSVCACLLTTASLAGAATIAVPAGGDLQAALNAAQPGDIITLVPGATYVGNFVLPNKGAIANYITLRSAALDSALPRPGVRMTPSYAALLPKIKSPNSMPALQTATAANHWKLLFLEFKANVDGFGEIIALGVGGSTQTQLSQVPYALVVDRVYVHGDSALGQKRGIGLNSSDTTIINSYVSECKVIGQDAQAIAGFNGPGTYLIENNYLEGAAENFLLGGGDPAIPGLVTTNVKFLRNHLRKPLAWRDPIMATPAAVSATNVAGGGSLAAGTYYYKVVARAAAGATNLAVSTPSAEVSATIAAGTTGGVSITWTPVVGAAEYLVYGRATGAENIYWTATNPYFTDNGSAGTGGTPKSAGSKWSVKNIFELKNAQDVLVEGNVFENLWVADQPGYPIVFTPRNQGGTAPWTVVQRVTFRNNLIRHTAGGVNILGTDNVNPSQRTNNITVSGNLFDDLTSATWGTGSKAIQLGDGPQYVTIDHNTIITTDSTILALYGGSASAPTQIAHVVYTNNMSAHNSYGIFGSNFASGLSSINAYMPDAIVRRNVLAGCSASKYPADNFCPSVTVWKPGFVNYAAGDYHLKADSPYKNAGTDGKDLGPDIDVINLQSAIALSGDNSMPAGTGCASIITTELPDGVFHQFYSQPVVCTAGAGGCIWQVRDLSLPAGIGFDATASLISGMPSEVQTGSIALDAYNPTCPANTASVTLSLTIDPPPFVVTMPAAPAAQVGAAFALTPTVSGAMGSTTWTVLNGTLPSGVALDAFSGTIAGTPFSWGSFTALVQAQDSWGASRVDAKPVTITVAPAALSVDQLSLTATYHALYNASLSVTGGTGSTTWSVASGQLPEGITLGASGTLSGTPTALGTFSLTVRAQDANWPDYVATGPLLLTVDPPVFAVAVPPSPPATEGQPYNVTATATGNVGTVTWTITTGTLPDGLLLNAASGAISGSPTTWGTYNVVVQGADSWGTGRVDAKSLTIVVAPKTLVITTTTLNVGMYGSPYQDTLSATGGTGAIVWSKVSGTLPNGVTLNAAGALAGTPTAVGAFTFVVRAADGNWEGDTDTKSLTLIVQGPIPLAVTTAALPSGSVAHAYQATLAAAGGTGLTTWSLRSGALPPGLMLGANGIISGTPAAVGTFAFTVEAADAGWAGNVATGALSITVGAREIVLYTADATRVAGTWSLVADASAAGGMRVRNPDAAAAKLTVALASPANYFEVSFEAEAGVAYHLWMRGKADNNAWANDSVYVQFSGTVDADGAAINRIGTTGAATVSIEDGTNAGLAGWGWADNSYGGFANSMYFATSGPQTIRVQVREDGLSLDQIVLSAGRFIATAPGATKNDTTLLAK